MKRRIRTIAMPALLIFVVLALAMDPRTSPAMAVGQGNRPVYRSDFRYVILSNEIEWIGRKYQDRSIQVLLDPNAFSERNLTILFELLLKRYPKPDWMSVSVVTSLEQVATPEEAEREIIMSHTNNHPEFDCYDNAILIRHGKNEFFRYTDKVPRTAMKTVVIQGCDAATSKCAK